MMLDATLDRTWDIAEVVARSLRRPIRPAGGDGGFMYAQIPDAADLEARILQTFAQHPGDLQLLDIASLAHISGKLSDLRHVADHLAETGALELVHRGGGRYYHLAEAGAETPEAAPN